MSKCKWVQAKICSNCGEAAHVWFCSKSDNISPEQWQEMDDDQRLEAEKANHSDIEPD